jgi:hypothetical protein
MDRGRVLSASKRKFFLVCSLFLFFTAQRVVLPLISKPVILVSKSGVVDLTSRASQGG